MNSGNPLLWLGNWNTQSITLLKSLQLPSNERERVGPIIRAVTDIFIRAARNLWLQRAKDSPYRPQAASCPNTYRSFPRPPTMRPLQRITPLGVIHRSIRIQEGAHPHLRRLPDNAASHDSNSSLCHASSLMRNDTSCLPTRITRELLSPGLALTPCQCTSSCTKFPAAPLPPCRNAANNAE